MVLLIIAKKKKKIETTHVVLQWVNGFTDCDTSISWNRSTTEQLKRSKILTHIITWIKFKKIILHEKKSQRDTYCMISFV